MLASGASAVVLDFEDARFAGGLLPPPNDDLLIDQEVPGYGPAELGLIWSVVAVFDVVGNFGPNNFGTLPGYYNGVDCVPPNTSGGCNGAYNYGGAITTTITATDAPFDLGGFNLTASAGSQRVRITGLVNGVPTVDAMRQLNALDSPPNTLVTLDWFGLTGLRLTVVDAVGDPVTTRASSWIMDNMNLTATPIPEPQTWALFGAGLLGVVVVARRRAPAR